MHTKIFTYTFHQEEERCNNISHTFKKRASILFFYFSITLFKFYCSAGYLNSFKKHSPRRTLWLFLMAQKKYMIYLAVFENVELYLCIKSISHWRSKKNILRFLCHFPRTIQKTLVKTIQKTVVLGLPKRTTGSGKERGKEAMWIQEVLPVTI